MSLDSSIASLMARLTDWRGFPKYSLERRVDIFLTPFLESFIGWKLNADATLVAPEFPLLANLEDPDPPEHGTKEWTAHTVNVDYLMHLRRHGGRKDAWLFVELKTDAQSFRDKQDITYWNAMGPKLDMTVLRRHVELVAKHTEHRHEPKYQKLLGALAPFFPARAKDPIELAYLGPRQERRPKPAFLEKAAVDDERRDRVHFLSLAALANQPDGIIPDEHRELWAHVHKLLVDIDPG